MAHAAAGLMSVAAIPPCLCIAIDSAGPLRSYNYLPFPPGTGEGGFRYGSGSMVDLFLEWKRDTVIF